MNTYTLTYARTVILKISIEAESYDEAMCLAHEMEEGQKLGLASLPKTKAYSWVDDITDDDTIWYIELIEGDEPD